MSRPAPISRSDVVSGSTLAAIASVGMTDEAAAGGPHPVEEDDEMGCLMDDGPVAVEADPIVEKAEQLAVAEMASISIHTVPDLAGGRLHKPD